VAFVTVVLDARSLSDFSGPGYTHPDKAVEAPRDQDCFSIIVSQPSVSMNIRSLRALVGRDASTATHQSALLVSCIPRMHSAGISCHLSSYEAIRSSFHEFSIASKFLIPHSQKPSQHMATVCALITERSTELQAMDKALFSYSPKVSTHTTRRRTLSPHNWICHNIDSTFPRVSVGGFSHVAVRPLHLNLFILSFLFSGSVHVCHGSN